MRNKPTIFDDKYGAVQRCTTLRFSIPLVKNLRQFTGFIPIHFQSLYLSLDKNLKNLFSLQKTTKSDFKYLKKKLRVDHH